MEIFHPLFTYNSHGWTSDSILLSHMGGSAPRVPQGAHEGEAGKELEARLHPRQWFSLLCHNTHLIFEC